MSQNNGDDVARLLDAIGGKDQGYRRFEAKEPSEAAQPAAQAASVSEFENAPLIGAVFGRDAPAIPIPLHGRGLEPTPAPLVTPEHEPTALGFLPPAVNLGVPELPQGVPPFGDILSDPASVAGGDAPRSRRSLREFREILTAPRPTERMPAQRTSGLTGLFDRLAK